jgi:hypothetical protein
VFLISCRFGFGVSLVSRVVDRALQVGDVGGGAAADGLAGGAAEEKHRVPDDGWCFMRGLVA